MKEPGAFFITKSEFKYKGSWFSIFCPSPVKNESIVCPALGFRILRTTKPSFSSNVKSSFSSNKLTVVVQEDSASNINSPNFEF